MISPAEIKSKALNYWRNQRALKAHLTGEPFFPLVIPFRSPSSKQLLEQFSEIRAQLQTLRQHSKAERGYGYSIEFKQISHRHLGDQLIPQRISFDSPEDFYRFIGKQRDFERFKTLVNDVTKSQPALHAWIEKFPLRVLEYAVVWPQLLTIIAFFKTHPQPQRYIRELDLQGVDGKFIEQHKNILRDVLDCVLPPGAFNADVSGLTRHGFERRYGLKYDQPLIRFRLLDHGLRSAWSISDMAMPLDEFQALNIPCQRVFITENKINGLSFPDVTNSIVIFGLGYGISSLKNIPWLQNKEMYYWGDIDSHGFAILSQLRGYYPQVKSFLMDQETLTAFEPLWGEEAKEKRFVGTLKNLTTSEQDLYALLLKNTLKPHLRLEQERISFSYFRTRLQYLRRPRDDRV